MKRIIYRLRSAAHEERAVRELRRLEGCLPSREARFAVPFVFRGPGFFRSIRARQTPVEIEGLYREVCRMAPRSVLEIGTAKGGTLYLWAQAASPDALVVGVDLPLGRAVATADTRAHFYRAFARPDQELHMVLGDSHRPETLARVRALFRERPVDFLFIDADHTYPGVKADFLQYGPLVRPGGAIAFHDIRPCRDLPHIQVDRLWTRLEALYPSSTFVAPGPDGTEMGIGLLRVPEGGLGDGLDLP